MKRHWEMKARDRRPVRFRIGSALRPWQRLMGGNDQRITSAPRLRAAAAVGVKVLSGSDMDVWRPWFTRVCIRTALKNGQTDKNSKKNITRKYTHRERKLYQDGCNVGLPWVTIYGIKCPSLNVEKSDPHLDPSKHPNLITCRGSPFANAYRV